MTPNHTTRLPRAYVYLDTEATREVQGRRKVQSFRLGVVAFDRMKKDGSGWHEREWSRCLSTGALWDGITGCCRPARRTVLVAHNLAYDLRISAAFTELPARGFEFVAGNVADRGAWFVFRNGTRTLCCVDTLSWVPASLERCGEACEIPKLPLPDWDDTDEAWFARCTRDVEILAEVWRRLMRWIEVDDLGNWKYSGAGQSWAAFRHRFMEHRLLVHENDDARAAERAASFTGRCEAWRHGKLRGGPFTEWDFRCQYATIGAECAVPIKLAGELHAPTLAKVLALSGKRALLCEVEVTTDVPTVPYRDENGIRWPTGTFATTLWDNEITLALGAGAVVVIRKAWAYRTAPALRDFCEWTLAGLDGRRGALDPVVTLALKHWSRALIGRTAARWSKWEVCGERPDSDVTLGKVHDVPAGESYRMMQLGTQLVVERGAPDNPHAMGAILSWVMAEARVRLWNVMRVAGLSNVVYVDTDSVITDPIGSASIAAARVAGLRVKGEWSSLEVRGPRQLIPGATLRASGVPRTATRIGEDHWQGEVWSGLARSLAQGEPDRVEVAARVFHLPGVDRRRVHLAGGLTAPVSVPAPAGAVAG